MIGLNVLNTYFKCTKLKTPFGQRLKYAKTAQLFRIRRIFNYSIPGLNFRFGVYHCALSLALISSVCLFYTASFAIELYQPGFKDSFVSTVGSPDSRNYGNIAVNDFGDLYVTGGGGREVYRIRDGKSFPVVAGQVLVVGVFVEGKNLTFGDFPTGGDPTRNLYSYDLIAKSFVEPPIDVRVYGGANDIIKAPMGWRPYGGQLIVAGTTSIYAYNPSTSDISVIAHTAAGEIFTNLSFTSNDKLLATTYTGKSIVQIDPDGSIHQIVSFSGRTEAVEVHRYTGDAFVVTITDDFRGEMYRVDLSSLVTSLFADDFLVNREFFPHPLAFSTDQKILYYGVSEAGEYVIRKISGFGPAVVNDLVSFEPDSSTYRFTSDAMECPSGFVGKFTFDAKLTNISERELSNIFVEVDELSNGNFLLTDFEPPAFLFKWGSPGIGEGEFAGPHGIAIDSSNNIYVADSGNDRVQKFSSDGEFLLEWGSFGSGDGQFSNPLGIAVDSIGNVYVGDQENNRVQKFTSEGVFLKKWGSFGSGPGQFQQVKGVAIDSVNNVYVTDTSNRVQKFTSEGDFITQWGPAVTGGSKLSGPEGIGIDSSGNVYVANFHGNRVHKFTSDGVFIMEWGTPGSGDGQFCGSEGLAVDSFDNIYVVDNGNDRVQMFTSDGMFITKWGSFGSGDGEFAAPRRIEVNFSGNVYVSEIGNNRIQVFGKGLLGEGESFKIRNLDDYTDGVLSPGEPVDVPFTVCLTAAQPFQFFVNVLGRSEEKK